MATKFQELIDNAVCKTHHQAICEEMSQAVSEGEYPVGMVEIDSLDFETTDYTKPVASVLVSSTWSAPHHREQDYSFNGTVKAEIELTLRGTHTELKIGRIEVETDMEK